ncbi:MULTISPECIES: hypothetical protein [Sphingomonas]|uniref:Peptidoglycan endopeptidase n=1 Tax=Sphingomonas adhaesiva TaxID=28212 RepID=A0A2A4I958_9SPHN|nr:MULTISPECIES: hypothetical protein [Sphingomonas]PCG14534.1 hypothetical protein COA07_08390 [Sphingomonas adhaesiva]PZU75273.1 MAG: hypothetical protein DI530_15520 [Sphingomonas sp.]
MTPGERVAAAALATVGARFRPQGRDPALGLDCVGVVAVAVAAVRPDVRLPRDYALRCAVLPAGAMPAGAVPCAGEAPGDVLLLRVAATQLHLAIRTADGIVHADAGAGRVVARPGVPPWPVIAAWRLDEGEG